MKNIKTYLLSAATLIMLCFAACSKRLDITPPNNITDQQIADILASGDTSKIRLVFRGMANNMPLLFNNAGGTGSGVADMYYTNQGLDVNRSLEGNDMILGDQEGLNTLWGAVEYQLGDFISPASGKNVTYWNYAWFCITAANQMLEYFTDELLAADPLLKDFKARGLVIRAYGYNYLMENYQDAYLQGGNSKLGIMLYDNFDPMQPNKPRATAEETYTFIKNDLTTALTLLGEAGIGYTANTADIDLGVVNFLLARVSVWTGDWPTAITACNGILDNYSTLMSQEQYGGKNTSTTAVPEYLPETNGFLNNAQNPEVILGFPLGQANTHFTTYMNCFGEGNGGVSRAYKRIDNRLFEKIDTYDYRRDCFSETALGNYSYPAAGTVAFIPSYTNVKYAATHPLGGTDKKQVGASTAFYMRASEVLLMKAEAEAKGVSEDAAKTTLNKLLAARTRTGATTTLTCDNYTAMAGMSALEMVQLQTRIELWGEGGREFYNNKRWNIPVDRTSSANHVTKTTYPVSSMTLKIPENEMLYNPLAQQND